MFDLMEVKQAAKTVYQYMLPTPQYNWPLLSKSLGGQVWVKNENHTPTAAFKVRGGLCLLDKLSKTALPKSGIISATRGNHGQSLSYAGSKFGIAVTIVVPEGNNVDQNRLIKANGANLIIHGEDFEAARLHSLALQKESGALAVAPFERELVLGVATYALELFSAQPKLDIVYAPIGMGSGICGLIKVRDLLGLKTRIVGVVAKGAPTFYLSQQAGKVVPTAQANTIADGVATRSPMQEAYEIIKVGAERVITVSDQQIAQAMKLLYQTTHNIAEGAGAVSLAGLMKEKELMDISAQKSAVVLSGSNINFESFSEHIKMA